MVVLLLIGQVIVLVCIKVEGLECSRQARVIL